MGDDDPAYATLLLTAHLVSELPPLPECDPIFIDNHQDDYGGNYCILHAFRPKPTTTVLHFLDGGIAKLSDTTIELWLTASIFESGRFEDITLVALQPWLRRNGRYLIHASGVVLDDHALLTVGSSGSGKTTTCLNLTLNGWQMLANDVVLVEDRGDQLIAWPVPDNITIRPKTFTLLPQLRTFPFGDQTINRHGQPEDKLPAAVLVGENWAVPSPVRVICFPTIVDQRETTFAPQMSAIALALLMQESIDLWDESAFDTHTQVLDRLTRQATCVAATLGDDLDEQLTRFTELMAQQTPSLSPIP